MGRLDNSGEAALGVRLGFGRTPMSGGMVPNALRNQADAGWRVVLVTGTGPQRQLCEEQMAATGVALPLVYRSALTPPEEAQNELMLAVLDGANCCRGGIALTQRHVKAFPGHYVLRLPYLGATLTDEQLTVTLPALVEYVQSNGRILRLQIELFSRSAEHRARMGAALSQLGCVRVPRQNGYERTLVIDLSPPLESIFAGLHRSARRNIREPAKRGYVIAPITDTVFAEHMEQLAVETMARTGGVHQTQPWAHLIRFSRENPSLSRMVGVFAPGASGPDSLLAYAWGRWNGDHVQYSHAASTRDVPARVACGYPLLWDLISWAKAQGAAWFDLGGVTSGHHEDGADPLGGISDFKRFFSEEVVNVSEEWVLAPHSWRSKLAQHIHRRLGWLNTIFTTARRAVASWFVVG
jgi:Acetyltransferase (GNAT) domain